MLLHSSLLKAWSFHQHFLLTVAVFWSTNYEFHEDFLWNLHQCIINPRCLLKLQKTSFDLQCLLRFQDHCPQERLSQDKKPLDDCPLDKCPLVKLPSSNNSSFDKSPKWLRPGWLLTKKVALEEICPTPGQLAPKKIALPLYNCFPRKFSSKKTPRQLPPWMLASGQFSTKKTPLKVTAPTPYNPPR